MRRPGDDVGVEPVDARLVHGADGAGEEGAEPLPPHPADDVASPQPAGDLGGERRLVERRALEDVEREGEGGDRVVRVVPIDRPGPFRAAGPRSPRRRGPPRGPAGEDEEEARVEAGREEDGDRHVRHQVVADRLGEGGLDAEPGRRRRRAVGDRLPCPIAPASPPAPAGRDRQRAAGGEGADGAADRRRLRHRAPEEEAGEAGGVDLPRYRAARLERPDLGGEAEDAPLVGVVERLDPERVAGEEERPLPLVPEGEGEHAAEAREHRRAVSRVEGEEDLGVALRPPRVAGELVAQGAEVVDLAVQDDPVAAVRRGHRLRPGGRRVEDCEPAVAEAEAAVGRDVDPLAVRPAGRHRVTGAEQLPAVDGRLEGAGAVAEDAVDAAHRSAGRPAGDPVEERGEEGAVAVGGEDLAEAPLAGRPQPAGERRVGEEAGEGRGEGGRGAGGGLQVDEEAGLAVDTVARSGSAGAARPRSLCGHSRSSRAEASSAPSTSTGRSAWPSGSMPDASGSPSPSTTHRSTSSASASRRGTTRASSAAASASTVST